MQAPLTGHQVEEVTLAIGEWLGIQEKRVAASLVVLGYAARLVGPAVAVLLRDGILLDLRPAQVEVSFRPGQGFGLALAEPRAWRGPQEAVRLRWSQVVLDEHLAPLISTVRHVAPLAHQLLWGNVASGLAGALRALASDGSVSPTVAHGTGEFLLERGWLAGTGHLSLRRDQLHFIRRSCCLYYRIPGGGYCGDCPLSSSGRSAESGPIS